MKNRVGLEFIAQESDEGIVLITKLPEKVRKASSVILLRGGESYIRSAASLRCLTYLNRPWPMMFLLGWIIPLPIRDFIYRMIARLRHRLWKLNPILVHLKAISCDGQTYFVRVVVRML